MTDQPIADQLLKTPLNAMHRSRGAKMVAFAGYDMPVHYPMGVLKEHLHTREAAGLFDVSHMGQILLRPKSGDVADAAGALEALMPMDVVGIPRDRQRYALFTDAGGGIVDDLMVINRGNHLMLVVNAAAKAADVALLEEGLAEACEIEVLDRALLALQGPKAAECFARLVPDATSMRFMDVWDLDIKGTDAVVSRSGYTGEDGYEISLPGKAARDVVDWLLAYEEVEMIGLGARDSLRLEAGLCLSGQDIDTTTTPVEAALEWAIQPARRVAGERAGGFPGAETILDQISQGATRRRVGLRPEGAAPMRAGTELFAAEDGPAVGEITSGGYGPSVEGPVAMGYVAIEYAAPDTPLFGRLRGQMRPVNVTRLPFITPHYKRR